MTQSIQNSVSSNQGVDHARADLAGASFSAATTGLVLASAAGLASAEDQPKPDVANAAGQPIEASFDRDYPPPGFKPSWKNPQINRLFVQDFVIYAHSELDMVKKLLDRQPALLNAAMDWGERRLGDRARRSIDMGRRDIVEYLSRPTAADRHLLCRHDGPARCRQVVPHPAAQADRRPGPHGFTLHFHAQVGGQESEPVLDYLQSIKRIEMKPNPFLKKSSAAPEAKPAK